MPQRVLSRQLLVLTSLLALVLGVLATLSPPAGAAEGVGRLSGTVRASDGSRLAGVVIDVFASDAGLEDPPVVSVATSSGDLLSIGDYEVELPPGDYRLRYTTDGYASRWYGLGAGSVVTVTADDYRYLDGVTMSPSADAVIQGLVADGEGNLVDDARVMAFAEGSMTPVATARTYEGGGSGHGYFALHVPPGTYEIRYSGPAWSEDYAQSTYPEPVVVESGDAVDLGTLSLAPAERTTVTGAVTSTGGVVEGLRVRLHVLRNGDARTLQSHTDADGGYRFEGVAVGRRVVACVRLEGIVKCTNGRRGWHLPGPRTLVGSDPDPVVLRTIPFDLVHVAGTVVDAEGHGVPGARVDFWRDNGDGTFDRTYRTMSLEAGEYGRSVRRTGATFTACASFDGQSSPTCLGGAEDLAEAATFTLPEDGDLSLAPIVVVPPCQGRVISNGVVSLGVNCLGQLNIDMVGLRYDPTGNDSTVDGCPCEGWGVADATSEVTGYANNSSGISGNLRLLDFDVTEDEEGNATAATSTVQVGEGLVITHEYRPSPVTDNAYEVNVSVENITDTAQDLRYRRVMDWDVEPTPFDEYVTMQRGDAEELVYTSDDGFASADPLAGPSDLGNVGDFVDAGPDDHGALFDFAFGTLAPGEVKTFHTFYGAAGTEVAAMDALSAISAEAYSLGQPSTPDGATLGTPNTFLFAFSGVGGSAVTPPDAADDEYVVAAGAEDEVLTVLDNDSTAIAGRAPRIVSSTQPEHGSVTCDASLCRYTPDEDFGVEEDGDDAFSYTITDGRGGFDTATVSLTVTDEGAIENTAVPVVTGSGKVGSPLTGTDGTWDPSSGLSFTYRWLRSDRPVDGDAPLLLLPVAKATGKTYTPTAADLDHLLVLEVTAGLPGAAPVRALSDSTLVVEGDAPTASSPPRIPSTVTVGGLVTVDVGTWTPAPAGFGYQWFLDGDEVPGATSGSFLPEAGDEGKALSVVVSTKRPGYAVGSATSNEAEVGATPAPVNSGRPVLGGTPATGETLTASPGTWAGSGLTFLYEWTLDGEVVQALSEDSTWTVAGDEAQEVQVRVVARKPGQRDGVATSNTLVIGAVSATFTTPPSFATPVTVDDEVVVDPADFTGDGIEVTTTWFGSYGPDREASPYRFYLGEGETLSVPSWMGGYYLEVEQVATAEGKAPVAATSDRVRVASKPYLYGAYRVLEDNPQVGEPASIPAGGWYTYDPGYVEESGVAETVEWYVDGVVVGTGSTYVPVEADGGKWLYAYVTGTKDGFVPGYSYVSGQRIRFRDEGEGALRLRVRRAGTPGLDVPGTDVSICSDAGGCTYGTAADGRLTIPVAARASGTDVRVTVTPPYSTGLLAKSVTARVVAGSETELEVRVSSPIPTPEGTGFSAPLRETPVDTDGDPGTDEGSYPVVYVSDPQTLTVTGCPGIAPATWTVEFGNGSTPMTGTLAEGPGGTYTGRVPGFTSTGKATVSTTVPLVCDGVPIEFSLYIDPSGVVTDQFGRPLPGARATLLHLDGGDMVPVPDGSTVMSPKNRSNPSFTDNTGFFRWDVEPGTYQVQVSDATSQGAACDVTTTPRMDVPPERVDLLVKLSCPSAGKPVPSTAPALSGTATVGQVLSVTQGTWSDGIVYERTEWLRDGAVVGTGSTYLLTGADTGKKITARVHARRPSYVQENGGGELVVFDPTSADVESATVAAAPGNPGGGGGGGGTSTITNTVKPSITGTAKVGRTLTANPGTWSTDGLAFSYQWMRDGDAIAGATGADYAAVAADRGTALTVLVTATRSGATPGSATSAAVTVGEGDAPVNQGKPLVTGTPEVGRTLSVSDGTWDLAGLTFTYQWTRDGEPIAGSTDATYVVTDADRGAELAARVTATRPGHAVGSVLADGLRVPDAPDEATPAPSTTKATILGNKIGRGERGEVRVKVTSEGDSVPTGTVTVTAGSKTVEVELTEADGGRVKVTLPKLKPGRYAVAADYSGDDLTEPSSDDAGKLKVAEEKDRKGGKGKGKGKRASGARIGGPLLAA